MSSGAFEPDETRLVQSMLRSDSVFVNVGANVGYYICLARKAGARCVAIEPLDQNVQILQRNVQANGWSDIEIHPVAVGDQVAMLKLYGGGTAASLVEGWAGASNEHYRFVPVTTLDNVLTNRFAGHSMLVLIDVEGFELNVLRGALRLMVRQPYPSWIVEICVDEHQPNGVRINPSLLETFNLFWSHGYRAERIGCTGGPVLPSDVACWAEGKDLPRTHNFLFRHL